MIHLDSNKRIRPYNTIGDAIRHFRKKQGYTQQQLADRIEVCQASIAHYESNKVTPPLKMLKALSRELECSLSLLIDAKLNHLDG